MPIVELNQVKMRELFPGATTRIVHTERMTFSFLSADAGAVVPEHAHPHEQVIVVKEGEMELTVGDETHRLVPGRVLTIPPNSTHSGRAITDCDIIDVFCPVREDFK